MKGVKEVIIDFTCIVLSWRSFPICREEVNTVCECKSACEGRWEILKPSEQQNVLTRLAKAKHTHQIITAGFPGSGDFRTGLQVATRALCNLRRGSLNT